MLLLTRAQKKEVVSPSAVEAMARSFLVKKGFYSLRRVRCRFHQGTLYLRGRVSRFYYKQLAQEAVRTLKNVRGIVNQIDVIQSQRASCPPVQFE